MTIRVVRLGSPRFEGEGIRIGTVRRPPRSVPKAEFASQNWCYAGAYSRAIEAHLAMEIVHGVDSEGSHITILWPPIFRRAVMII
jgi:uncharacterized protein YeaO (DUF488 family)